MRVKIISFRELLPHFVQVVAKQILLGYISHARELVNSLERLHPLNALWRTAAITPEDVVVIALLFLVPHFKVPSDYLSQDGVLGVAHVDDESGLFISSYDFLLGGIVKCCHN